MAESSGYEKLRNEDDREQEEIGYAESGKGSPKREGSNGNMNFSSGRL